jgi:ankyrin repeat protein
MTNKGEELYDAAERGDVTRVTALIQQGASLDFKHKRSAWTPLHAVILGNTNIEVLRVLVEAGAELNSREKMFQHTPLHAAVLMGNLQALKLLVDGGADLNIKDLYGDTPLYSAAANGKLEIARELLEGGAQVHMKSDKTGWTPLLAAVVKRDVGMARILMEHGAVNELADKRGTTCLHVAARNGHMEMLAVLIKGGAHLDTVAAHGQLTALHEACEYGQTAAAKFLVLAGARTNVKVPGSESLCETYPWLIPFVDEYESMTLLHRVCVIGIARQVPALIELDVDLNAQSAEGMTALHFACKYGRTDIAKILVDAGAITSEQNNDGETPLLMATGKGNVGLVRAFAEGHANLNEEGITSL